MRIIISGLASKVILLTNYKSCQPELVEGGFIIVIRVRQAHPDIRCKSLYILFQSVSLCKPGCFGHSGISKGV